MRLALLDVEFAAEVVADVSSISMVADGSSYLSNEMGKAYLRRHISPSLPGALSVACSASSCVDPLDSRALPCQSSSLITPILLCGIADFFLRLLHQLPIAPSPCLLRPARVIWQTIAPSWHPPLAHRPCTVALNCSSCFGLTVDFWPSLREYGMQGWIST